MKCMHVVPPLTSLSPPFAAKKKKEYTHPISGALALEHAPLCRTPEFRQYCIVPVEVAE